MVTPITSDYSKLLQTGQPNCWVCGTLMLDSRHNHHLIPRAFGGLNGPTVDICADDHNVLHRLALRRADDPSVILALLGKPRLAYLTNVVRYAREVTKNNKNKRFQLSVTLSGDTGRKLADIKRITGSTNNEQVIGLLISEYHSRRFIK